MPRVLIDALSSAIASSSKRRRGWYLAALSQVIGKVCDVPPIAVATSTGAPGAPPATAYAVCASPSSADRPRPRPFFFGSAKLCSFARELDVGLCAGRTMIVEQHRNAVRRRFRNAHVARNDGAKHALAKMRAHI